ncbi:MAG: DegT/DnrJ/EryC1/StrS family aminotransferase [Anaerolineaceae bacterium]|nr:DegT/DnrJ/EryC1/StrS family aminotransferase [Betaproteobacteria bacterium]
MNKQIPAILGGSPTRTRPFFVGPMVDEDEERYVLDAIREHNFSRYIGAYSPDIEMTLRMTSEDAAKINAPWHFLGGPGVRSFAAEFANKMGVDYAIPVNSATSGLSVALAACGVGAGDEVIVPGLSFGATGAAVLLFNSIPVFVDVDPQTFCIAPGEIEKAITEKTKAILVVHLLGNVCDMAAIMDIARRHRLSVIEDCAQAPGAKWREKFVGSIGDAGVFSFQQSKNIMTGEGGMIITNDPEVARKCRLISNHGEMVMQDSNTDDELVNVVGCNFRLPELCAALGRAQLKKLDRVNAWRNGNAQFLIDEIGKIPGFTPPYVDQDVEWVCHVLSFLYDESVVGIPREVFVAALRAEGIPVGTGYVRGMYEAPIFLRRIAFGRGGSPWTDGNSPSAVTYSKDQCPVISKLINEQFIWFYHIAHPSTAEDMLDIVNAIRKLVAAIPLLIEHQKEIMNAGDTQKSQGRL